MSNKARVTTVFLAVVMAGYIGWFLFSPFVLVWNAPYIAVLEMASASWLFWFILLIPIWAPALVSPRKKGAVRVTRLICGVLLIVASIVGSIWFLPLTNALGPFVVLGALLLVGVFHITGARRRVSDAQA
jgi:heme/copper-type cytochrome/quinol oxidase subunit 4